MKAPDGSIEKLRELLVQGDGDPVLEKQMELFSEVMRILVPLSQQATRYLNTALNAVSYSRPQIPEIHANWHQTAPIQVVFEARLKNGDFILLPSETEDFRLARVIGKRAWRTLK